MKERFRLRFHFWLDMNKSDEADLAQTIDDLKQRRSFAGTVRDGIRLAVSLARGDVSVLQHLFPQVVENIYVAGMEAAKEEFNGDVANRLDELTSLVRQIKSGEVSRVLPTPAAPLSQLGEVALEVKTATSSEDNKSNWNFMIASALTVYGSASSLSPEIIDYGLRTGRLTSKQAGRVGDKKDIRQKTDGNPKAMEVPQFEAPSFEDTNFLEFA